MKITHNQNIAFLKQLFKDKEFSWIEYTQPISFTFFKSGGGTHLYIIANANNKFIARINYYQPKNEWWVKEQEFKVLKLIEPLKISPKVYFYSNCKENSIKQDLTIVEFIEGDVIKDFSIKDVENIATDLYKLHTSFLFDRAGDTLPPQDDLPYSCNIYNEFANGEDKQIEKYSNFKNIEKVIEPYNRINEKLENWFNNLGVFKKSSTFCLCHADIKKENILTTNNGTMLIDWECAASDIPETDIGRLFSGCEFTKKEQEVFLKTYYKKPPNNLTLQKIDAIKKVLDFFHILEDYILLQRKKWNAEKMLNELIEYEKKLDKLL